MKILDNYLIQNNFLMVNIYNCRDSKKFKYFLKKIIEE